MGVIEPLFARLRAEGRRAFIPFITAGDPNLEATEAIVDELVRRGADLVEIGFPYSDPIADGPVIQASYTRALAGGIRAESIRAAIRRLRARHDVPLIGMVSYSLVFARGVAEFVAQVREAGLAGLIVPDLPEEEVHGLAQSAAQHELDLIQLVTPTTPRARAGQILRQASGFVYCVSVAGITGERDRLPDALLDQLRWLRSQTSLPLCVGFGISRPEHVRMLRGVADGVIVGSALVRHLEQARQQPIAEIVLAIGEHAQSLCAALNPPGGPVRGREDP